MKVLLDECLPRPLARALTGHEVVTVQQRGWSGKTNGELLALASQAFDVFVTIDQHLASQQRIVPSTLAVIVLRAPSNDIAELLPLVPQLLKVLSQAKAGEVTYI